MKIISIQENSPAEKNGILPLDELVSINGLPARDQIDVMYCSADDKIHLELRRGDETFEVELEGDEDLGLDFEEMRVKSCGNKCIFCFVDQNPTGLRKTLYIKDEDYRLSFLHGSYVTLTTMTDAEIDRIIEQRLSPLYVSVHATEPSIRRELLSITKNDLMLEKIDRLVLGGILLQCQIVVCPGINDESALARTIEDLHYRFPIIGSVAVVPVGITRHREGLYPLTPVDTDFAAKTIDLVDAYHQRYFNESGVGFVYCADEWYIRAEREIPEVEYYDEFIQIENGVGMVRDFLEVTSEIDKRIEGKTLVPGNYVMVTGVSMSDYIEAFSKTISTFDGLNVRTVTVTNNFFGETVTVSGLLTGIDIMTALEGITPDETVVLPPNCLNGDGLFLDEMKPADIAIHFQCKIVSGTYEPLETFFK